MNQPAMYSAVTPAAELASEPDNASSITKANDEIAQRIWSELSPGYDREFLQQARSIHTHMQALVDQLLHGCGHRDCESQYCATGLRNTTRVPMRNYTPRSARIVALQLLDRPEGKKYICKHLRLDARDSDRTADEGPRDPSSFVQQVADTSCIRQLAGDGAMIETEDQSCTLHKVLAMTWVLEVQCEPPFLPSGSSNPNFESNMVVVGIIATAFSLLFSLLPENSSPTTWQRLAQHINNGRTLPSVNFDSTQNHDALIRLLEVFACEPNVRLCAAICKVIAHRTQLEDVSAKHRQIDSGSSKQGRIMDLLAERLTGIAVLQSASNRAWVPWSYPLWFKKAFIQDWDGKPVVKRGTIACGALELLEMQQKRWDRLHPHKSTDAHRLPYIYKRVDPTEMMQSWMQHDPPVTTGSRHLLSFPFLYLDNHVLMNFRMLNHLRMREAYKLSHVNEEVFDRFIAGSNRGSLGWEDRAPQTQHLRDFYLLLNVRRGRLVQDAFNQLWQRRKCELLRPLRIRLGEMEGREVGQDLGGVQIEFFNLICKALFSEDVGMFSTDTVTGLSYFRPGSLQPLYMFEMFGLLVALAAYNGITIPVSFPLALYKHLLGIPCTELHEIQDGWPEIARSLQSIKDGAYEGLDYVFPLEANGVRMSVDGGMLSGVRAQADEYTSGKRATLDLHVDEMSRIDSAASAASANPYQPSDHQWPGWSVHAPAREPEDPNDTSETIHPTSSSTSPQDAPEAGAAVAGNKKVPHDPIFDMLSERSGSDPNLRALMQDVATQTATPEQLEAFQNHVNKIRADMQSQKRRDAAAEIEETATSSETSSTTSTHTTLNPSNIPAYISDYTAWLTHLSVLPQIIAFTKGFHAQLSPHHLALFTPQTLAHTIEGSFTLDLAALRSATQYKDYTADEPYIVAFWRVLSRWPQAKQKALLKFVTAAERIPITGAGSLTFRIQNSSVGLLDDGRGGGGEASLLPTSSTCFGTLYLPRYRDEEMLERKLGIALEFGGVGFGTA